MTVLAGRGVQVKERRVWNQTPSVHPTLVHVLKLFPPLLSAKMISATPATQNCCEDEMR